MLRLHPLRLVEHQVSQRVENHAAPEPLPRLHHVRMMTHHHTRPSLYRCPGECGLLRIRPR